MQLDILSPERTVFSGQVDSVTLPGAKGSFTVLKGHAALLSSLEAGKLKYVPEGGSAHELQVASGFVKVENDNVTVCAEL